MHDFQLGVLAQASLATKNCLCPPASRSYFNPEAVLGHGLLHLNELIKWNSIRIKIISPDWSSQPKTKHIRIKAPIFEEVSCTYALAQPDHLRNESTWQLEWLTTSTQVELITWILPQIQPLRHVGMGWLFHTGELLERNLGFQTGRLNFLKKTTFPIDRL